MKNNKELSKLIVLNVKEEQYRKIIQKSSTYGKIPKYLKNSLSFTISQKKLDQANNQPLENTVKSRRISSIEAEPVYVQDFRNKIQALEIELLSKLKTIQSLEDENIFLNQKIVEIKKNYSEQNIEANKKINELESKINEIEKNNVIKSKITLTNKNIVNKEIKNHISIKNSKFSKILENDKIRNNFLDFLIESDICLLNKAYSNNEHNSKVKSYFNEKIAIFKLNDYKNKYSLILDQVNFYKSKSIDNGILLGKYYVYKHLYQKTLNNSGEKSEELLIDTLRIMGIIKQEMMHGQVQQNSFFSNLKENVYNFSSLSEVI